MRFVKGLPKPREVATGANLPDKFPFDDEGDKGITFPL